MSAPTAYPAKDMKMMMTKFLFAGTFVDQCTVVAAVSKCGIRHVWFH